MANNILMVSLIDGKIHLLTLKKSIKSYQLVDQPIFNADKTILEKECKKANAIYVNADFPSANYFWENVPTVGRKYSKEIVLREARQKFGYSDVIRTVFQEVGQTFDGDIPKKLLSCVVVENSDVFDIENEVFGRFKHKISHICPLANALCAMVSQVEKPDGNFMVISINESSTILAIGSPMGDVKVSRQVPIGLSKKDDCDDVERCKKFFEEIEVDIENTNLYFQQNFPGEECRTHYMLGSPSLQDAYGRLQHGSSTILSGVTFGFSDSPLLILDVQQATAWACLIGSLYCHKNYDLLNPKIAWTRNISQGYKFAMGTIAVAIIGCGFYLYQIDPVGADRINEVNKKNNRLANLQNEVFALQNKVHTLDQFSGWKMFYENTYKNQPAWNTLFSQMAFHLPKEIVFDSFRIDPGGDKGQRVWNCLLTGHIKVIGWEMGLELLREFGTKMNNSPDFRVVTVKYSPIMDAGNHPTEEISFDFQINAQLTTRDTDNEK